MNRGGMPVLLDFLDRRGASCAQRNLGVSSRVGDDVSRLSDRRRSKLRLPILAILPEITFYPVLRN